MNGFLAKLRLLPPPYILGSSASTFELLTRLVVASAVQPPDRDIENTRKGDPCRQRKEAPAVDLERYIPCIRRSARQPIRDYSVARA